ncbi:2-amino-4-hydroxy-6-hydroxymethyldihydropteridinediphosphokinase [Saccharicrinis carchari]|uniref:2-amino-4-hydroxy-6-hydroxymethyldihydropteridine pyrophosphokinase n=1 Tax=Saccharicrinis carchari TaxID=1168039 RepID=A0A521BW93_SACCC|nr:2-amino-4-hydroxy-6-hydroxymethyldihydropteridine diphosphokinase [Saccharicrinis carchari]SMO50881.1 2-amino-4-hydroxy-6-hydroxymethyldihydropteridinediphosphokinase [Saccharicrinis carchari]
MNSVILLVGGNEGNILKNMQDAKMLISNRIGDVCICSAYYESEPWGFEHQQNFLNRVIELLTDLSVDEILLKAQQIEKELGRKPKTQKAYEGRTMDIDILFFNDETIELPRLSVPHPKIQERKFTLLPLAEHWGDLVHPVLGKTIKSLLRECQDQGWVEKVEDPYRPEGTRESPEYGSL